MTHRDAGADPDAALAGYQRWPLTSHWPLTSYWPPEELVDTAGTRALA
jgi:hypothetical protein